MSENAQAIDDESYITESILLAQSAAESEVSDECIDVPIAPLPRFFEDAHTGVPDVTQLVMKTNELKEKGKQLDLLLLKAETYSHFIRENQERTKKKFEGSSSSSNQNQVKAGSKRKATAADSSLSSTVDGDIGNVGHDGFTIAPDLKGDLMPHQKEGLKWLLSLWENGLSGILADEMGLGKTIQIISLIAQLRHIGITGPFLIAGPLATLPNWMKEFQKWLPSCPVVLYHGSKEDRQALRQTVLSPSSPSHNNGKGRSFPVLVTSFEVCMIDRPHLDRLCWQYIILDEGHRIKNRNCRLVRELKKINSVSRLLLTGTPIQNSLEELWSLLNFVNPMIFDNLEIFQSWFSFRNIGKDTSVEDILGEERSQRIISKLHEILRPFLLRRMKALVFSDMPLKKEIHVYCGMSSLQREYYARVLDGSLRDALLQMGIQGAPTISQINMNMNLRKVCNHPFLFGEPEDPQSGKFVGEAFPHLLGLASGKFKLLGRMLPILRQQGHKVLIFSQMTRLLDILHDFLHAMGFSQRRLDGAVKMEDRQRSIEEFNADPDVFCFLLSTRAGGLGINLTAADTCIIFDSDWNPHCDLQAQDRCHRIGQTRDVVVYRLVTQDSVEIEMLEKQSSKKKLDRMTMHGGDFSTAGYRKGPSGITISYLRQLLEDDVKLNSRVGAESLDAHPGRHRDISDQELELILDRNRIFSDTSDVPRGDMFDVIAQHESKLQTVG